MKFVITKKKGEAVNVEVKKEDLHELPGKVK